MATEERSWRHSDPEQPASASEDGSPEVTDRTGRRARGERSGGRFRRMLPRTALGMSFLLLCMSLAAAFSGAVLYAYYDYRLGQTEDRVDAFVATFAERMEEAIERIESERDDAVGEVRAQLEELERFSASGETLNSLLTTAEPSVWFVSTFDEAGGPSVGSAFVAFSDGSQSFLVTSFTTVRAATEDPGPDIVVRKGDEELPANLTRWDPANDLALLVLDRGDLPALTWAAPEPPIRVGDRLFAVSGLGGSGGSIAQGFVAGVSAEGIQHGAPVGAAFQGGPLLNSQGEVVAVASRSYAPLNFSTDSVFFGVPVRNVCSEIIRCPDDDSQPDG
jgi:S1-C subfamily serine protease